jgi:hypothetical protein
MRERCHLWWVDDGAELVDAEHAEVADGEGPALELLGLQLADPTHTGTQGMDTPSGRLHDDG